MTVERALEKSSDVAAVKTALKLGPDRFYSYIKAFGFGSRSGIQLPAETRGLLRPTQRWNATSIGYLAIGHEIAVTPIQLVTMVSTIGNGGMYLPPSILLENIKARRADQGDAVSSRTGIARSAARRCASRDLATDLGQDAQDDGRCGAGGQWPPGGAQRLLCRGQDGHGAEDRSGDAHLFAYQARCLVCRLRAGEQSGDQRGHHHRLAEWRAVWHCGFRANFQRGGARGTGVSGRAA